MAIGIDTLVGRWVCWYYSSKAIAAVEWARGWEALASLATSSEGRAVLLRERLVPAMAHALREALDAADAAAETRALPIFECMANLTFDADGQIAVLRATPGERRFQNKSSHTPTPHHPTPKPR